MSKYKIFVILLVIVLLSVPTGSFAQDDGDDAVCDAIVFLGGWSRPAVSLDGTGNGAGYGILVNLGEEDDRLLNIHSEAASEVEIHEVIMTDDDVMQMRPLADGLPIPAGGFAQLQPGGFHIMYIGLTQDFVPDEEIAVELDFENADPISVSYTVSIDEPTHEDAILGISGDISGCEDVGFYGGWATPTTEDSRESSVYGLFLNLSDEDVYVVGAEADVAGMTGFATNDMVMDDEDDMEMEDEVVMGLEVPANGFSLLSSDGLYLHLMVMEDGLAAGEMLALTFIYDDDTQQTVTMMVQSPDMSMDMGDMESGHDMDMDSEDE